MVVVQDGDPAEVKDLIREYYRDVLGFDTFEGYCKAKWDFGKTYASRLISSASVMDAVLPIGNIKPATESQCRPLARLEPSQQREAWQQAVDTAPGNKVTAAHIAKWGPFFLRSFMVWSGNEIRSKKVSVSNTLKKIF
jgi:hypothetical protein